MGSPERASLYVILPRSLPLQQRHQTPSAAPCGPSSAWTADSSLCPRAQLWAEAVHRYKAGETWWLDDAELENIAREEQSKRFKGGVHLEVIRDYLERHEGESVSIDDILEALGITTESRNQMH